MFEIYFIKYNLICNQDNKFQRFKINHKVLLEFFNVIGINNKYFNSPYQTVINKHIKS